MSEANFYALAIAPGLIVLGVLIARMFKQGGIGWPLGSAVVGCLLAVSSPWISIWFVRNVLGDNTANIGAVMMVFAQPVLAPMGASFGALVGGAIGVAIGGPDDADGDDRGDLPPIA